MTPPTWGQQLVFSGISTSTAMLITHPLEVIKVRLQTNYAGAANYQGLFGTTLRIIRDEGIQALWKGLQFGVLRSFSYGGLRLGLYGPIRDALQRWLGRPSTSSVPPSHTLNQVSLGFKVGAGLVAGSIAATLTNPLDLLKVRQQGSSQSSTMAAALQQVVRQRGVLGLWDGTLISLQRAAVLTAGQAASYDHTKHFLLQCGLRDDVRTHALCALCAGAITTTAISPFDILKTRLMQHKGTMYRGPWDCFQKLVAEEGPAALLKGWVPNYIRQGPHTLIVFTTLEQLYRLAGVTPF
eukprot:EG_transcript_17529